MQTPIIDTAIRQLAIVSISGYQKHISPKKGFACAHRVLYGGESCSQYCKSAIAKYGLFEALKALRRRFASCKQANRILRTRFSSQSSGEDSNFEDKDRLNSRRRSSQCHNNCGDAIASLSCDSIEFIDCSGADCSGLDCSGADCSGVDCCSAADCGSCF